MVAGFAEAIESEEIWLRWLDLNLVGAYSPTVRCSGVPVSTYSTATPNSHYPSSPPPLFLSYKLARGRPETQEVHLPRCGGPRVPRPLQVTLMKPDWHKISSSLWSRPDPVLAAAGRSGELLVAKIRISLAVLLLLIPFLDSFLPGTDRKENLVGFALTVGTFVLSTAAYFLVAREYNPPWLSFASSCFDVTLVSAALTAFLVLNQP